MWGLTLVLSALSLAAAQFLLGAFGVDAPSYSTTVLTALAVLAFGSAANMIGSRLLKSLLYISMTCELIASLGIGTALLFFHRTNPFSVLFTSAGTGHGAHWLFSSFFGVVAFIGFSFLGFESAGSIAEEVQESRRVLPKAITLSLLAAGILVMFASLGIVLSIPDIGAVISGKDANPIATTLETRLGSGTGRVLLIMLTVGFTASLIGVQAAVTRAIWASARDKVLPGSRLLGKLSGREHLPRYAIALTVIIAGSLLFISTSKLYALLLSFGNAGFFLSYALPVAGAAYLRWRGRWTPGGFTMGRWSSLATYVAAVWIILETINIAWPRPIFGVWYLNWGLLIMTGILGVLGIVVCARVFRPGAPGAALAARRAAETAAARPARRTRDRRARPAGRRGRPRPAAAVITGAASGIGAACAVLLKSQGWHTAGIDLRDSDTDLPLRADVADRAAVAAAADAAAARFGRIDLAVSAAGYYEEGIDVTEITQAQWDRMLAVILGGTVQHVGGRAAAHAGRRPGHDRRHLVRARAGRQRHRPALRRGQGRGARLRQVAGDGAGGDQHPGQRGGARPDRHAAAGQRLGVARARLPGHAAARAAGHARRDRQLGLLPGHRGRHVLRRGALAQRRGGDLRWRTAASPWSPARPRASATRPRCGWRPTGSRSRSTTSPTTGGCPAWPRGPAASPSRRTSPIRRRPPPWSPRSAAGPGRCDVLVANAAAMAMSPFLDADPAELVAPDRRQPVRPLPADPGGGPGHAGGRRRPHRHHRLRLGGDRPPNATAYAASKAGLIALAKGLGQGAGPGTGILTNAIAPSFIDTEQLRVDADRRGDLASMRCASSTAT